MFPGTSSRADFNTWNRRIDSFSPELNPIISDSESRLQDGPPGVPLHDGRGRHVPVGRHSDSVGHAAAVAHSDAVGQLRRCPRRRGRVQPHVLEDDLDVTVDLRLRRMKLSPALSMVYVE